MQKNLTTGSVFKNIITFSVPYLFSYFLQTLYGIADLYITGQFNGSDVITAVSVGSQVMHMITVIIVGLAMGTTVLISQFVGANHKDDISGTIGNTITIFTIFSFVLTVLCLLATNGIVHIMSTPVESLSQTTAYLRICFIGIPFITAYNVLSSIFRGMGDSKSPLYFIAISCMINIILDYIFIGFLGLGAIGAALGTVLSQTCSVLFAIASICRKKMGISLSAKHLKPNPVLLKKILQIGLPVAVQDGFIQISFLIITIIANRRGVEIAAAVGIVEKIICFVFLIPSSMLSTVSALAAQNNGAGFHKRAKQTLYYGILICVGFGLFFAIICQFASVPILSCFSDEEAVILFGSQYLRSYIFDCMFAGIHFCYSGYFCAYNHSIFSFIHNTLAILLVRIPGTYLTSQLFPDNLFPMGMAAPAGSLFSALICVVMYWWLKKGEQR